MLLLHARSIYLFFPNIYRTGVYRWQDGAIVANNPTIFAIREAQQLWPDAKIDCLVSIGCGSVPTKVWESSLAADMVKNYLFYYMLVRKSSRS